MCMTFSWKSLFWCAFLRKLASAFNVVCRLTKQRGMFGWLPSFPKVFYFISTSCRLNPSERGKEANRREGETLRIDCLEQKNKLILYSNCVTFYTFVQFSIQSWNGISATCNEWIETFLDIWQDFETSIQRPLSSCVC